MVTLVTDYGSFDLPLYWDGTNGLDYRLPETVNGVAMLRFYAPAYALALQAQDRAASAGAMGFAMRFTWDDGTSAADPGAGKVRIDNATAGSATAAYVNDADANGSDRTGVFALFDDGTSTVKGLVSLVKLTDPSKWLVGKLTATTDGTGFWTLTLTSVQASGATPFTAADSVVLGFVPAGDKGDTGDATDIPGQTATTTAASDDLALIYDTSAAATRKVTLANFFGSWTIPAATFTAVTVTTATVTNATIDFATFEQAGQHKATISTTVSGEVILADTGAPYRAYTITGDTTLLVAGPTTPGYVSGGYRVVVEQGGVGGFDVTILPVNELTYSADLQSTAEAGESRPWSDTNTSLDDDAAVGPDGQTTLTKLIEDAGGAAIHLRTHTLTGLSPNQALTLSVIVKDAGDGRGLRLEMYDADSSSNAIGVFFNPTTGATHSAYANGAGVNTSQTVTALPNSCYRVDLYGQPNTSGSNLAFNLLLIETGAGANGTYAGDGTSGLYAGEVQVSKGSPVGIAHVGATRAGQVVWPNADEPDWAAQAAGVVTEISLLPAYDGTIHAYKIRGG